MSDAREQLEQALVDARDRSTALTTLPDDELVAMHSPLMSPLVWDLAHVANYEELWLARAALGLAAFRPELDDLYDAFAHPRAERPALPILRPAEARSYALAVRERAWASLDLIEHGDAELVRDGFVHAMVAQHEQQHAETMLATHQLRAGAAILTDGVVLPTAPPHGEPNDVLVAAGPFQVGTSTDPWALDNERPAHWVDVPAFRIDVHPVSNAQFAAFIDAGGYDNEGLWTAEGWAHRNAESLELPAFWHRDGAGWFTRRRFGRIEALPPDEPVQHVTFHEACAYARWRGRRLPTEAEWEKACGWDPDAGTARRFPWGAGDPTPELANLAYDPRRAALRPAPVGAYPAGASAYGVEQLIGDVWEWTSSAFNGYPGFRAWPYPEYSQVFFGTEYRVLRGGSWASHPSAVRTTFRNWDFPIRRQIFAGFRTATSVEGD